MRAKIYQQMTIGCGKREGATQEDVDGIVGFKPTDTRGSKCIQACLGEASGVVSCDFQTQIKTWQGNHFS